VGRSAAEVPGFPVSSAASRWAAARAIPYWHPNLRVLSSCRAPRLPRTPSPPDKPVNAASN